MVNNKHFDLSVQRAGLPGVKGCIDLWSILELLYCIVLFIPVPRFLQLY